MKRTAGFVAIGSIIAVLAAGWVAASWYTGKQVETEIRQYIDQINQRTAPRTLTVADYERGLFSSRVRYVVNAAELRLPGIPEGFGDDLTFVGEIHHGPWPASRFRAFAFTPVLAVSHTRLQSPASTPSWLKVADDNALLEERSTIHYDGSVRFVLRFAPVAIERADAVFGLAGGSVRGVATSDLASLWLEGELGDIQIRSSLPGEATPVGPVTALVQGVKIHSNTRRGDSGLYPGDARVNVDRITVNTVDDQGDDLAIVLNGYAIEGRIAENASAQTVAGNVRYTVSSVQLAGIGLGGLEANLRFDDLDGKALKTIMARYREIQPQLMAEADDVFQSSGEGSPLLEAWLEESLQALLPGKPRFGVDPFRWTLPEGESHLVINVGLQPPAYPAVFPWLQILHSLDAELVVSRPMAIEVMTRGGQIPGGVMYASPEQAREAAEASFDFIQRLALASGYVVQKDENLVSRVTYANGEARLNGEPVSLADLIGLLP